MGKKKEAMIEAFVKGAAFTIEDRPVKWAMVLPEHPDTKYEHRWKVDVVLDEAWKENLQKAGFNIYQDGDGDWILRVIKKVKTRAGKTQAPPTVVAKDGTPVTVPVGNGSVCDTRVYAKYNTVAGKTFLNAYLNKLTVNEHVLYEGGADDVDFEDLPF
jgi:hypothetical protein